MLRLQIDTLAVEGFVSISAFQVHVTEPSRRPQMAEGMQSQQKDRKTLVGCGEGVRWARQGAGGNAVRVRGGWPGVRWITSVSSRNVLALYPFVSPFVVLPAAWK